MEKKHFFRYALDHEGHLVNVTNVNEENRHDGYRCVSCGGELIPALGKVNVPHFRHKTKVCSYETYLHKAAKHIIKYKFDTVKTFEIVVPQKQMCRDIQKCKFGHKEECFVRNDRKYDLKCNDLYDKCLEEQTVLNGQFVADLLLSTTKGTRKPLLIEIWVTHKSTEEKIKAKLPIIEIHINNESQIDDLLNNPIGHKLATYDLEFFNFKENSSSYCHPSDIRLPLSKFTVYNSGKSFFFRSRIINDTLVSFDCSQQNESKRNNAQIEIVFPDNTSDYIPLYYCYKRGITACYCPICLFSTDSINGLVCKLFKTKGTPHYPQQVFKINCGYFRLNNQQVSLLEEKLKETVILELCEDKTQTELF